MNSTGENTLFQAVADQDYDRIIRLYARTAFDALSSYSPYRRRSFSTLGSSRKSRLTHEEKIDDYHPSRSRFKLLSLHSEEVRTNIEEQTMEILNELMSDNYFMDHPKSMEECSVNSIAKDYKVDIASMNQYSSRPAKISKSPRKSNTPLSHEEEEIENILQISASYLSNSRPDPTFMVHAKPKHPSHEIDPSHSPSTDTKVQDDSKVNAENEFLYNNDPIFDGSIAHSTPGNVHDGNVNGGGIGTILHLACILDAPFTLAILLAMQADVSSRYSAFRRTAIHEAACSDSIHCLQLLIDVSTYIHFGKHPSASEKADSGYAKNAIFGNSSRAEHKRAKSMDDKQNNAKLSFTSTLQLIHHLSRQIKSGIISELDASINLLRQAPLSYANQCTLVESFADILGMQQPSSHTNEMNTRSLKTLLDGHGNSALHWAAFKNSTQCLSLLLQLGMDPNVKSDISGWTPLHDAAYANSFECIEMLIKAGGDLNKMAHSGATPLCFASQENSCQSIRVLLKAGADPTIQCCGNSHPLSPTNFGVAIPINNRFSGYTALHYAAHYNSEKAAKILLENNFSHGCNLLEIPDLNNKLPIHIAAQRGSSEVLRELLHSGARVVTMETPLKQESQESRSMSPLSSPFLRSMIPSRPISSSRPWNCLSQRSIDECRLLIDDVEKPWSPSRHPLFYPSDRVAIVEVLRVGKRFEQRGTRMQGGTVHTIFLDLWPLVLSFCGRGWFEPNCGTSNPTVTEGEASVSPSGDLDGNELNNFQL